MRSWNLAWLLAFLVVACGAKAGDGPRCVDVSVSASDSACSVDGDCTFAMTGHVCDGDCACATNAEVNQAAASRIGEALSTLALNQKCECGFPGYARCVGGQCTACPSQQGTCTPPPAGDE